MSGSDEFLCERHCPICSKIYYGAHSPCPHVEEKKPAKAAKTAVYHITRNRGAPVNANSTTDPDETGHAILTVNYLTVEKWLNTQEKTGSKQT